MQVALMREIEKQNSTAGLVYPSISYAISHACTRPHNGCKAIQYCSSNVEKCYAVFAMTILPLQFTEFVQLSEQKPSGSSRGQARMNSLKLKPKG